MTRNQKLELTWIGKDIQPKLEPRILIEDPEKSYGYTPCPSQEGNKIEISQEGKEHTPNPLSRGEYKSPLLGGDLGVGSHIRYLINHIAQKQQTEILQMNTERNAGFFDNEMEKLDKWAEDVKGSMEIELKELDKEIKCRKTEAYKEMRLFKNANFYFIRKRKTFKTS